MEPNVSCGASLGGPRRATCQLYVGHDHEHCAVVLTERGRVLRRWANSPEFTDVEFSPSVAAGLPWAPGQPLATGTVQPNLTLLTDRVEAVEATETPEVPEPPVRPARPRRLHVAS